MIDSSYFISFFRQDYVFDQRITLFILVVDEISIGRRIVYIEFYFIRWVLNLVICLDLLSEF